MEWKEEGKNIQSMGMRVSEMEWRGFVWTVIDWDEMLRRRKIIKNDKYVTLKKKKIKKLPYPGLLFNF
jgi:hypothetical protein